MAVRRMAPGLVMPCSGKACAARCSLALAPGLVMVRRLSALRCADHRATTALG